MSTKYQEALGRTVEKERCVWCGAMLQEGADARKELCEDKLSTALRAFGVSSGTWKGGLQWEVSCYKLQVATRGEPRAYGEKLDLAVAKPF